MQTVDDLKEIIENVVKPTRFAIIIHDKDIDEKGQPVEAHAHAMMSFDNPRHASAVAKQLGDKAERVEVWKGNSGNGYAYLVHRTQEARHKYQYDPSEIIANFDFPEYLLKITQEVESKNKRINIQLLLDALYDGSISKAELEARLTGSQYGKYKSQIENIYAKRLQNEAEKWRAEMREQGKQVNVLWIFGEAGVGKTKLALEYAEKANQSYFVTGSSKDIFQQYSGEHTMIMDELRPNVIPYQDLLRITDPFGIGREIMAPSRYSDKALACDTIIITSPYNPLAFYDEIFGTNRALYIDNREQLLRRIALIIYMDEQTISAYEYDRNSQSLKLIPNTTKANTHSTTSKGQTTVDPVSLYNSIFD